MDDRRQAGDAAARAGAGLSVRALDRLVIYVALLRRWQAVQNLVAAPTLDEVWSRHVADCLQLVPLIDSVVERDPEPAPGPVPVMDFGSGAGLPGLVLALATADRDPGTDGAARPYAVGLVESNGRKAAFLRAVSRETGVPVTVHQSRIEAVPVRPVRILTARALAPLARLVGWTDPWLGLGATALFHKGVESDAERAAWPDAGSYSVVEHPGRLDPSSRILQIERTGSGRADTVPPQDPIR